jgi:diguanylate cyclase
MLIVDLAFATLMMSLGAAAGWWLSRSSPGSRKVESDRAAAIIDRLGVLANTVADNVGEHATRVSKISTDLSAAQASNDPDKEQLILNSLSEILKSNERLQEQLATAEVQLQRQAAELETQAAVARTDALTSLCNRRALDDELARRLAEWQRRHSIFSLVMIDVDHFKKFNDVHGHQAGDEVLRGVAQVLTATMREMDMVARFGGEEFALVLPLTNLTEGLRAAERARHAIAQAKFNFEGIDLQVTASLGVAEVLDVDNAGTLVKRADAALYSAKGHGRNRVWYHSGDDCRPAIEEKPAATPAAKAPADKPAANATAAAVADKKVSPAPPASQTTPPQSAVASTAAPKAAAGQAASPPSSAQETPSAVFATDLRRRLLECQQYNVPLALMFVEIDDFSQLINDLGSATGELLLKTYSDLVGRSLTEMDVVSRLGGRLAVMMPGTNLQGAVRAAERVRNAAAACRVKVRGEETRCTASLGVTEVLAGDTPASLSQRADSALLASKAAGKNCTHAHDGAYCGLVRGATSPIVPHAGSAAAALSS